MYVITGGAGFIGSNIAAALEEKTGRRIVICDRLRDGIKWCNIAKRDLYDIVHPDELFHFLKNHSSNIKAVIHMGAISATTETDVDLITETNIRLSWDLWTWCTHHQTPFIYASSAATYGDGSEGFKDGHNRNHLKKLRPLNAYGWSKHLFDRRIARAMENGDPRPSQWAGLKFFNVYGPNEGHKGGQQSVVAHLFPRAQAGQPAKLFKSHHPDYEDGGQLRDFVWVGDCVNMVLWLLDNPQISGLFNCGTGKARSFLDLAKSVYKALGQPFDVEFVPTPEAIRDKYQYFTEADMSTPHQRGFTRVHTSLEDGVANYVQNYLTKDDPCR